jgi:hypothetical protein
MGKPRAATQSAHGPGSSRHRAPHYQRPMIVGVFSGCGVPDVRPGWAVPAAAGVTGAG